MSRARHPLSGLPLLAALAGCMAQPTYAPPPERAVVAPRFDPEATRYALHHGRNVIVGQAIINRQDGQVASCAGRDATLVPATSYTRERMRAIYGGRDSVEFARAPSIPRDREFDRYTLTARCDAAGEFRFSGIGDGSYFVVAPLRAAGEGSKQGVSVRDEVRVRGGETRRIVLVP